LIGGGARENALAWLIQKSEMLDKLYCVPGNPGFDTIGSRSNYQVKTELIDLNVSNHKDVLTFCGSKEVDLVVVGPEQPLSEGLTDILINNSIKVFGPTQAAAKIETSKSFAKSLMAESSIPTASSQTFSKEKLGDAMDYIESFSGKVVLKADGLAAGKGVVICEDKEEAKAELSEMLRGKFGEASKEVLIEEFMEGVEISVFVITDGSRFISLPAATDHKRVGDGDTGSNTGGMGAFAPSPYCTDKIKKEIEDSIITPLLKSLLDKGTPFIGCVFCGLMLTQEGPKVVEFNARFGDPELQAISQLVKGDFLKLLDSAARGELDFKAIEVQENLYACNLVLAAEGYPLSYPKGMTVKGDLSENETSVVFHAGTKNLEGKIITSGGRVLSVVGIADSPKQAVDNAYLRAETIDFEHKYNRSDIAEKLLLSF
jgi:phosphoribosylamine--glycine ligase